VKIQKRAFLFVWVDIDAINKNKLAYGYLLSSETGSRNIFICARELEVGGARIKSVCSN
jgi:hypothetical protein